MKQQNNFPNGLQKMKLIKLTASVIFIFSIDDEGRR